MSLELKRNYVQVELSGLAIQYFIVRKSIFLEHVTLITNFNKNNFPGIKNVPFCLSEPYNDTVPKFYTSNIFDYVYRKMCKLLYVILSIL